MARLSSSPPVSDATNSQPLNYTSDNDNACNDRPIAQTRRGSSRHSHEQVDYSIPDSWGHLGELAPILPVENPNELSLYRHRTLEEFRSSERECEQEQQRLRSQNVRVGDHITTGTAREANSLKGTGKPAAWLCLTSRCAVMWLHLPPGNTIHCLAWPSFCTWYWRQHVLKYEWAPIGLNFPRLSLAIKTCPRTKNIDCSFSIKRSVYFLYIHCTGWSLWEITY